MNGRDTDTVPIDHFILSLTSQLDRAQSAMAVKARAGLPLTFAVRDLTLDLRAHVDVSGSAVRIRPAGPDDREASTLHLSLTTITKPMIEENTRKQAVDPNEISLDQVAGGELSTDDLRRLEWAGVQTVSQLKDVGEDVVERVASVPAMRLRAALQRAVQPLVHQVIAEPAPGAPASDPPLIRVRGHNLKADRQPDVRIKDEAVPLLHASNRELVFRPLTHQLGADVVIEPIPGHRVSVQLPPAAQVPTKRDTP